MLYFWLKFIHVLSSTILFGTGIGTACTMLYGHRTGNTQVIAATTRYVVLADWIFTGTSGFLQPLTGLWMVYLAGYAWSSLWVMGSIIGYAIAALCWFPVVYLQIKMRDFAVEAEENKTVLPPIYYRYFKYWFCLGWPAFISLIIVFYLMTNKPVGF
ncbi:MAG: DUF2269 domain-containing protein [Legionella sp.]|uniref:DUF2269 family protein n=1 Tax=Legionella sp. TaxID=459 RepID=UPI00283C3457|nr:DUF2269 domain-containing protein [Legionella sp.]